MATAFDPTQASPDWDAQRAALLRAYNQGLIGLNANKGQLMSNYGFLNTGDYTQSGQPVDFSNLQVDPNQQYGAYRNELKSEADMLDAADNGPNRGFSGGLSKQASRYAQQAAQSRQTGFQQNLQSQLGNMNLQAGNQAFNYQEGITDIGNNAKQYAGSMALWQAMNPTAAPSAPPGASGGGSTPFAPVAQPIGAYKPIPQGPYTRTGPETPMTSIKAVKPKATSAGQITPVNYSIPGARW